jgi:hypothetical protein
MTGFFVSIVRIGFHCAFCDVFTVTMAAQDCVAVDSGSGLALDMIV